MAEANTGTVQCVATRRGLVDRSFVIEFMVDFLGILVPGVVFTALAGGTILLNGYVLCRTVEAAFGSSDLFQMRWQELTKTLVDNLWFILLAFFLLLSYVMGHLCFRKDPKEPDERSARKILNRSNAKDRNKGAVRRPAGGGEADVQFPYLFMREYLTDRGLDHLAQLVPWRGSDPLTHHRRSKMFLNILKIRLQFYVPEKCFEVARNEAHVRLMSSVWHAAVTLKYVEGISLAIAVATSLVGFSFMKSNGLPDCISVALWDISVFVLALWVQYEIEKFLHYQRVREVVYVLEAAFVTYMAGFKRMFQGLKLGAPVTPPSLSSSENAPAT